MTNDSLDDMRDRLVLAALNHIPFDGWSDKALRHAAADCGLDASAPLRAFPHGVLSAVEHFTRMADRMMAEDARSIEGFEEMPVHKRVEMVIRQRLERWAPEREAVRRAMAVYALPQNMGLAAQATWRTVDSVWKVAGDQSADFNWYTKRASLAGVYSATLLYWLDDQSEDMTGTYEFLARRLDDVVRMIKARHKVVDRLSRLPNPLRLIPRPRLRVRPGFAPRTQG